MKKHGLQLLVMVLGAALAAPAVVLAAKPDKPVKVKAKPAKPAKVARVEPPDEPDEPEAPEPPEPPDMDDAPEPPGVPHIVICRDDKDHDDDKDSDEDDDNDNDRGHGTGPANLKVKGAIAFHMQVLNGTVDIVAGGGGVVDVSSPACPASSIHLSQSGDDIEAEIDEPFGCTGPFHVKLPSGSRVEVKTVNGDVVTHGALTDVELEAVTGDVSVERGVDVEVHAVNGKVHIGEATGKVSLETVRGDSDVSQSSNAPRLEYQAVSGGLTWKGLCGSGCRLEIESFSGEVKLNLDPKSSFGLKFSSHTGELKDNLGVKPTGSKSNGQQKRRATFGSGSGDGSIECETFSGSLQLGKK